MAEPKDPRLLQFSCVKCGAINEVSVAFAGRERKCGECGTPSIVPMPRVGLGRRRKPAGPAPESTIVNQRPEPQPVPVQSEPASPKPGAYVSGHPPSSGAAGDVTRVTAPDVTVVTPAAPEDPAPEKPGTPHAATSPSQSPGGAGIDGASGAAGAYSVDLSQAALGQGRRKIRKSDLAIWSVAAVGGVIIGALLYLATQTDLVTTILEAVEVTEVVEVPIEDPVVEDPEPVEPPEPVDPIDPVEPDPPADPDPPVSPQPPSTLDEDAIRAQWTLLLRRFEAADRTLGEIRRLNLDRLEPAFQADTSFIAAIDQRIADLETDLQGDRNAVFGAMTTLQKSRADDADAFDALADTIASEYLAAGNQSFANYIADARTYTPEPNTAGFEAFWRSRFSSK